MHSPAPDAVYAPGAGEPSHSHMLSLPSSNQLGGSVGPHAPRRRVGGPCESAASRCLGLQCRLAPPDELRGTDACSLLLAVPRSRDALQSARADHVCALRSRREPHGLPQSSTRHNNSAPCLLTLFTLSPTSTTLSQYHPARR